MIWLLALRNIIRNKRNSIVIILLIAVITMVFFIGNSILFQSSRGLKQSYIENLTGDIVIEKSSEISMNLFGANTPVIDDLFTIPSLPLYDVVKDIVLKTPGVAAVTSQVSGQAVLDLHGMREGVLLCGLDGDSYFKLFPGIHLQEGRFLKSGEPGAMMTDAMAARVEKSQGRKPAIGDPVLLTAAGSAGVKIREVPLVGIYAYTNPGQFMDRILLVDAQNARILSSIQLASSNVEVSSDALSLLGEDLDDLFGGEESERVPEEGSFTEDFLKEYLSTKQEETELDGGDWNFIILRLQDNVPAAKVIRDLNKNLEGYGVTAVGWRTAAGNSAILALLLQTLFNAGIVLVSIAGILAIVNILLIAVFRRTREIGTLRAIGASDTYIRSLILSENCTLAFAAGILGVILGLLILYIINNMHISINNELIVDLLGGEEILVGVSFGIPFVSLLVAVALGFLASLYPIQTAVKIDPIVAVRQG